MELFDSHCHIDVEEFDADRDAVLQRSRAVGVTHMLVPAVHMDGWRFLLDYCRAHPGLYPALGMHPVYLDQHRDEHISALADWVEREKPLAIGEIGLDYFVTELDRERQQTLFEAQLEIARDADLPVVLHVRKAHDQMLSTLKRIRVKGGFSHAFNGSEQQARQYIDLGFKLGFGGMMTYDRSNKIRRLASVLPLDCLVLETDAPDMTVAAHRGERNSPEYLPDCLQALSEIRQQDPDEIARQTTLNALQVLGLAG
ncbi:MAG: TatD family deoxyribonuclease [Gammaproteobacteria bacterium]|nr:MAG: TatD family deoxyribonuclease [Gammaproteobacteria bacterium]